MFMKGRLAELMSLIAPQTYRKYVTVENGKSVMCQGTKSIIWDAKKHTLVLQKVDS